MNKMYRWTRHIYDASRKYYLLGRDTLIQNLQPKDGEQICCVGCGTGRNLIKLMTRYPKAKFYGIDASDMMLETAENSIAKAGMSDGIKLAQGYAQNFDPVAMFNLEKPLDKVLFSYSLSMIPPSTESIDHALSLLPMGGQIHIVDFSSQSELPKWFRGFLFWWLKMFHVYYRPEIEAHLRSLADQGKGTLEFQSLYKGYAYYAVFTKA